ncbi:DegT/DnrJ/EryC1/StrS family aminotransferase [Amorphus sp. 3PC139-8]|uniref:DegT/DnrJ/EryC1/StrS family aminotransferase n=1 Tax=Amorphus sp. 3PC139-8 TaxID=2735676 RepID=UPI00345D4564
MRSSEALAPAAPAIQSVPLFDLKRQQARLRADIDGRIAHVLDHGQFILGPEVEALERDLAAFADARHCIAVSSGRDALIMALMAVGAGPGDAVFVPAFTFSATAGVVASVGASPVFVDVDAATFNMDPMAFEHALDGVVAEGKLRPVAVMPVDLYGLPADYPAISAIAEARGLQVIADAAQSFGGKLGDRSVGALAPISCTSFYPTKPLGAFGDGGGVFTEDGRLAEAVRQIRTHGRQGDGDEALRLGMTGRLDTIQAAVLQAKLSVFAGELVWREEVAARYDAALEGRVTIPHRPDWARSAWALYTVRVPNRDRVREQLSAEGIGTGLFYRIPLHRHPAFATYLTGREDLPVSDRLADEVLSLPMGPDLTDAEIDHVVERLLAVLG